MARALWKGGINFGLVHIPVGLYPAETHDEIDLDMLDGRDLAPIHFKRVNEESGKEVEWEEIVKGFKDRAGKYVIVTAEDFEEARLGTSPNVEIAEFVDADEISPLYFERPYYLAPTKNGIKGYVLLREALKKSGHVAVARVVIRTKEHLAVVIPIDNALILNTIRFSHEIKSIDELEIPASGVKVAGVTPQELKLAEKLIGDMKASWEPEKYKDTYQEKLRAIIKEKQKQGGKRQNKIPEEPTYGKVVDLMAQLKSSVEGRGHAEKGKAATAKPAKKKTAAKAEPKGRAKKRAA